MSEINEFARDLVKRQIDVYNEYKSKKYDMTQPLSVLICCSIIIFSDYMEKHNTDSLIKEIKNNDNKGEFKNLICNIYDGHLDVRLNKYLRHKTENKKKNEYLNEELKEYEVFFHDLRNEFAHLIEKNISKMNPEGDKEFSKISINYGKNTICITKEQIVKIIELIDKSMPVNSITK